MIKKRRSSCTECSSELDAEETLSPQRSADGAVICDSCHRDKYQDDCARCGERVEKADLDTKPGAFIGIHAANRCTAQCRRQSRALPPASSAPGVPLSVRQQTHLQHRQYRRPAPVAGATPTNSRPGKSDCPTVVQRGASGSHSRSMNMRTGVRERPFVVHTLLVDIRSVVESKFAVRRSVQGHG